MNAYILVPNIFTKEALPAVLEILNIDCIIDFITYKPSADDPLSSNNILEKYSINDYMPSNFLDLSKEERLKIFRKGFNLLNNDLVKKSILPEGDEKIEKGNIAIFCSLNVLNSNIWDSWIRSYYNHLYEYRNSHKCFCIEFVILDFHLRQSLKFNTSSKKLYFFKSWHYKNYILNKSNRDDFIDDDSYDSHLEDIRETDELSQKIWLEEFYFNTWDKVKTCKRMDDIFQKLEQKYSILEKDIFVKNLYSIFLEDRGEEDSYRIEKLKKKEDDKFWDDDREYWAQNNTW